MKKNGEMRNVYINLVDKSEKRSLGKIVWNELIWLGVRIPGVLLWTRK
jgi:hypothetical protein